MASDSVLSKALSLFIKNYGKTILAHYLQAPVGVLFILFFAFLIDMLIGLLPFTFPSSAICMIITFATLVFLHWVSPHFLFHHFHQFFHPAAEFLLACMGLFFTSSFILIPRRDSMPAKEIGLLAALFLPTFLLAWFGTVALCKLLAFVWPQRPEDEVEEDNNANVLDESEKGSIRSSRRNSHQSRIHTNPNLNSAVTLASRDSTHQNPSQTDVSELDDAPTPVRRPELTLDVIGTMTMNDPQYNGSPTYDPEKASISNKKRNLVAKGFAKLKQSARPVPPSGPPPSPQDALAKRFEFWFDFVVYFTILLIGIPIYYTPGGESRSLPLFTGVVSCAWLFSRRVVPQPWQKLLHPILVTSFITIPAIWALGAIKGNGLTDTLNSYSTGATYLVLFRRSRGWDGSPPGAGDLMSSLLVGGIVMLAFPLFRYRTDLYRNFLRLIIIAIPNCAAALLLWPLLARLIGISGERAVTFAGRFMSTPFGIQLLVATGGDSSLVVVLICVTGIMAVLIRDLLFKIGRTRVTVGSDEYFTIGCTIGVIAGAIGTSSLMGSHSRAAATATVMFVLYGLILLGLVAVPDIAEFVARLAGL